MPLILVMLTSGSDFDFERLNINVKENILVVIDLNSNGLDYYV